MFALVHVSGVIVLVVLVLVTLVDIVDVARFIAVMFVVVALVDIVDVARLIAVMFVSIALVNIVLLHYHGLRLLASRSIVIASVPIADTFFVYHYNL